MKLISRRINILFKKITRSVKFFFQEIHEEFCVILRNRNYSKTHPYLFAIFSIIEQEQNPQIYEIQKRSFKKIKEQILQNDNTSNHKIIESLRGIFHNNKVTTSSDNEVRKKIVEFLFKKTKVIINQNDLYYFPLLKVILFAFPFLLNYKDYEIIRRLVKRKSSNSLKLIKDILNNYHNLDFFISEGEVTKIAIEIISVNNKPAFMLFVKFLRRTKQLDSVFSNKSFIAKTKIIDAKSNEKRGIDFSAIYISYLQDKDIDERLKIKLEIFLRRTLSSQKRIENAKKYNKIISYINLNQKLGYQNSIIESIAKSNIANCEFSSSKKRSHISRIQKLQKSLFNISKKPRADVKIKTVINFTNHHPEEHWLIQFSPYLL